MDNTFMFPLVFKQMEENIINFLEGNTTLDEVKQKFNFMPGTDVKPFILSVMEQSYPTIVKDFEAELRATDIVTNDRITRQFKRYYVKTMRELYQKIKKEHLTYG